MELFIFIVFQLLMEVQSYKSPTVKVSPDVIRESSSVKISCETPADVRVNQCYFITNREEKNVRVSSSCELERTGAEVLRWAGVKSPVSIYINCFYTIHERGINKPSSDSPPATVTVLDLPQVKLRASASVILETDTVELSCENTEDLKMEMCYFYINGEQSNSKVSSSCQLSLTGSQISVWSGGQSSSVRISCFYTVMKGQIKKPSAHSDPVTVTVQISTPTTTEHTSTKTAKKTNLQSKTILSTSTTKETIISMATSTPPGNSRMSEYTSATMAVILTSETPSSHRTVWFIVLVFTGVAVILSGLTGLICLCRFAKLFWTCRDIFSDHFCTSHISAHICRPRTPRVTPGQHSSSHRHSFFHYISKSIYQPSDALVNKKTEMEKHRGKCECSSPVLHNP
ncbi:uncharacterized protein [Sinocyclocheilus grahami]|uniref:uncharacterized protein n=1 Tax=Sinocyclocheilus grahami TaxID=75366 RepID=UPI0007AC8723|nr:PREDICTED: uncharacterized protein LOC107582457 [Sinocyclocheilus grahami]